ncbi:hypothetical protein SESBI_51263, partial [Sesbania bispinosa]
MDKGEEDVMRGGSRFSTAKRQQQQSSSVGRNLIPGFNGIHGDLQFSEKSKKEKVRSLSAVAKALSSSHKMGCNASDSLKPKASSIIAAKRFKLPKKFLNNCNGVQHASVPRKIRSAMKKRGRESTLTDSEKVNHKIDGIESPEKDGIKKSKKHGSPGWSTRQVVTGPITKDEEEVAETLYALAGMFPNNGSNTRTELECESLPGVLQDQEESTNATFEASETTQDASLVPERSPKGAAHASSINETTQTSGQEQTDFPGSAKFLVATHSTTPTTNLQAMSMMVRSENGGKVAMHDSELCLKIGLNAPIQSQNSHIGRQPDVEFEMAGGIDCKQEQHATKHQKENEGLALWPGLSLRASAGINASNLQSSSAKAPAWLNAGTCASKQDLMGSCSSGGKMSKVAIHKKSWKRCAAHVHISHLIRSLEMPKRQVAKEPELYECHQIREHQGSKCEVQMETHNLSGMRYGNSSAAGTAHSATVRNSHETNNGILQQQCNYHDISQAPPTPGVYGPQKKQNFNFLSLSAGGNGLKVNDSFNKNGSRLEPLSNSQVAYFQSLQQQHGHIPIPTTQSQYASTSYLDQFPAAGPQVRLQQQSHYYHGTPLRGAHYSPTVSYKQQQQSFWAVQLAAQGGSAVNCNIVRAQFPNWQNGRVESSAVVSPFGQVILPNSPASREALGSKITSISDQQQPFTLTSSLPPSRTIGLDIQPPPVCEESR